MKLPGPAMFGWCHPNSFCAKPGHHEFTEQVYFLETPDRKADGDSVAAEIPIQHLDMISDFVRASMDFTGACDRSDLAHLKITQRPIDVVVGADSAPNAAEIF